MKITIKEVLLNIGKNASKTSESVKLDTNKVCKKITSMYQDIDPETIFILKDSKNATYYMQQAYEMKPLFIITDAHPSKLKHFELNIPIVYVDDFPKVANNLVKLFYNPAIKGMKFIAVTGTNGKTTTSHMIGNLLTQLGEKVAIIGTMGVYDCYYHKLNFNHTTQTTPMYFEMAEIINYFYNKNYDYIVYEATSIALDQRRTDFIQNDLAVFTNFSPEHLEYHGSISNYLNAKLRLDDLSLSNLVNLDTKSYHSIVKDQFHFSSHPSAYYHYHMENDLINIVINQKQYTVKPRFQGGHNYINLAASIFALHKLNFDIQKIVEAAMVIESPLHRFQIIKINNYVIILDFAHTSLAIKESINNALKYSESIERNLNVMVTGIGLRGLDKVERTISNVPDGINKLMLAAEQVGYVEPKTIINMMVKHLPSSYKVNDVLKGVSRKEGIKELLYATDKEKEIILLTGINEPQNYKGKKYEHDDEQYIKTLL
ncbi:UDP-N-acetylmuramoylalanyl-D-glutamate--2,6-diaminopimelate ligase [Staphylococcus nepalensis]|uniref:UDP-N-acetylmuramoylalanyl-D-glutamate--2, 6-diaminopimelate ligase n=1 Tax=Staphylococcus nepalensis TaxID=214473 RepID=A0ABS3L2F2_9STAP|nr:Mur ligase family protein [Staphylococcus nepalensis]MBO1212256.1 UDP-N-acetylmuramoylalanyl-D-glutamate--2,6-diaminopimelate ligase [Staphylococcus nepalensis]MBO1227733.1 UDP-N-acetylmuramoylalanyl-D-glutamate--2,6-diaminopimelate ligase [Staphylococcus nepalensis]MBO1235369.1 UDP-N-acetylmuramoylalanyl-D-glutamate--2,6-diaminopimelate ligase [Staphylococcus nepalensis]